MASRPAPAKKSAKPAASAAGRKASAKAFSPAKSPQRAAAASGKASAATVVTLKNLAEQIAEAHDLSRRAAAAMLEDVVERVTAHLKRGERIRFGALGILEVRNRPARMGRNPATGEAVKIKASKKVAFRDAKALKEAI
jgi:DNA-binding protein HU-beta